MKIQRAIIENFRRIDRAVLSFEDKETLFVGPNNSGKTSATSIFRCFVGPRDFKIHDFPLAKLAQIDRLGHNPIMRARRLRRQLRWRLA